MQNQVAAEFDLSGGFWMEERAVLRAARSRSQARPAQQASLLAVTKLHASTGADALAEQMRKSVLNATDPMAVLLEAAAEDIKLIDCLGPEDLCYDPTSADGLKPLHLHGLRSRAKSADFAPPTRFGQEPPQQVPVYRGPPLFNAECGKVDEGPHLPVAVQHGSANAALAAALEAGTFHAPISPPMLAEPPARETEATPASPKAPVGPATKHNTTDRTRAEVGIKASTTGDAAAKDSTKANDGIKDNIKAEDVQPTVTSASPVHNRPVTRRAPHNPLPAILTSSPASAGFVKPSSRGSSAQPVTRVQRFAAHILQYIRDNLKTGQTETFESVIRRDFGNNPDISKALRLLVAEKNVKRAGKGGRSEPFKYQLAARAMVPGDSQMLEAAAAEDVPAGNADSSPMPDEHHTVASQSAAKPVASAAIAAELHRVSDKPQHKLLLRRSISLPSNLSSLAHPTFLYPPQQSMALKPSHQEKSLATHFPGVQPVYVQPDASSGFLMAFLPAASVPAAAQTSVFPGAGSSIVSQAAFASVPSGPMAACLPRASAPIASGRAGVSAFPRPFGMHNAGSSVSMAGQSNNAGLALAKPLQPSHNACKEVQNLARPERPSTAKFSGGGQDKHGSALKRPSAGIVEDKENFLPDGRQVMRNLGPQHGVSFSTNPDLVLCKGKLGRDKVDSKASECSPSNIINAKMHSTAVDTTAKPADTGTEESTLRKRVKLASE